MQQNHHTNIFRLIQNEQYERDNNYNKNAN